MLSEATHVRGDQSAALLDLRMACLDDRLREMGALAEVLSHADAQIASKAVAAAQSLATIASCSNTRVLLAIARTPADVPRVEAEALHSEISAAKALRGDGAGARRCGDARGVYAVTVDAASSSPPCAKAFPSPSDCRVTQEGCAMTFACTPDPGFNEAILDSSGRGMFLVPESDGVTSACSAIFNLDGSLKSFEWECTYTAAGGSAVCKGHGESKR